MTNGWIKVRKCLFTHPKVMRIARDTGLCEEVVVGWLMKIWSWADDATADGNVDGVTHHDVVRVTGVPVKLLAGVQQVGWFMQTDEGVCFPDYEQHMSNSAKKRAKGAKRTENHRKAAKRLCNAQGVTRELPEKRREEKKQKQEDMVSEVIGYYTDDMNHSRARPGDKEKAKIRDRLKEGYSVEDLKNAIDGCHLTPHNMGHNDQGTKYLSLALIMRDSAQVARFIENKQNPPKAKNKAMLNQETNLSAVEAFLKRDRS